MIRKLLRCIVTFLTVFLVMISAGIIFEKVSTIQDEHNFEPPGELISINSVDMHIYGGGVGDKTVVFASGWGIPGTYTDFYPLASHIEKNARVVMYDRPGYGWSEETDASRDIDTIVNEVHDVLHKSGEKPPFILVGHSLASLELIHFAQVYKEEVSGIVLLDAGNPDYYGSNSLEEEGSYTLIRNLKNIGIIRLLAEYSPQFSQGLKEQRNQLMYLPDSLKEIDQFLYLKNMLNDNVLEEEKMIGSNANRVIENGWLGDIPMVILTSEEEAKDQRWLDSQKQLCEWSSNSKQKIIKGTNHNMHHYKPDAIINAIYELLD